MASLWHPTSSSVESNLARKEHTPVLSFGGDTDGTREVPEDTDREEAKQRVTSLFNLVGCYRIQDPQCPFTVGNLPPRVWTAFFIP
jgi:hypothetical protein